MNIKTRLYQSPEDIYHIGQLLRTAFAAHNFINAWSFAQFDIWAQRRLADTRYFDDKSWEADFLIYEDQENKPVGAVFASCSHHWRNNPIPHTLILSPDHLDLASEMLDWVESRTNPEIDACLNHHYLVELLEKRGYQRSPDFMVKRQKLLAGTASEPVQLATGYRFEKLEEAAWSEYFTAVHTVFKMMDNPQSFGSILQSPSNVPELHQNIRSESGEIAAFCSVWLDRYNNLAEFEPVGTLPNHQKKGLAAALLAKASNDLRQMGCSMVSVESWSESEGANKLYASCGLLEIDQAYSWKKE
jgi:ribosomal protein S18 acetylase RimI-like enzyme